MEHAQPPQLMDTEIINKWLLKFMIWNTPEASSTDSAPVKEYDANSHLHPLGTVKGVLKLVKVLPWESESTAGDS